MADPRRFNAGDVILLLLVLALAAGARVWYLTNLADGGRNGGPLQVQDSQPLLTGLPPDTVMHGHSPPSELDALVHNLTEHRWFGCLAPLAAAEETTAHVAPGYPWLVSWLERAPIDLSPVDRTVRWLQCGLGTFTAAFYFLFARRAFAHRTVAILAGLFCALYPFWIINTAEINDGVLATFLLAACLFLSLRGTQSGAAISSLLFGLALAGLALVRATLLPFTVVALLWFLWHCRTVRRGWLCALLAFLGFTNGLVPWTLRNFKELGGFVPIADSACLHVWEGINSQSTGGAQMEQTVLAALADARREDVDETTERLGRLPQRERYASLREDILKQVESDSAGVFKHRLEAGVAFFFGEEWLKQRTLWRSGPADAGEMPGWFSGSYAAILYGALFAMLVLGVLGWRWTYSWRHQAMPSSIALVWVALPYILSHAESLHGPRLPLDGVLLCYAAFALACIIPPVGRDLFYGPPFSWETEEKPH
jgi:hypothetical protein